MSALTPAEGPWDIAYDLDHVAQPYLDGSEGIKMSGTGMLGRFSVLEGADLEVFRASVSRALTPHRLEPLDRYAPVHSDVAVAPLGPISLIYAEHHGADLGVQLLEDVDYYDVNISCGGSGLISLGSDDVLIHDHMAGIVSPSMTMRMHLRDGYRQLHLRVERHALERHLEDLIGEEVISPLTFWTGMDLRNPAAASWVESVRLLVKDLDHGSGLAGLGAAPNPWANFLMTGLLLAQRHNYSDRLNERRSSASRPRPVKRAIDLIEESPESCWSIDGLALRVGVSARSLQRHFRDHVGMSPRAYILQVRLARAHDDLVASSTGSTTVMDIAMKWGFSHASRFAAAYQDRYGVAPSITLRQA